MNVNRMRKNFISNIIIGIVSIIVFLIVQEIGYNFYYINFIPQSREISVRLAVIFVSFFIVIPSLLCSSFLKIKRIIILFLAISGVIYVNYGMGSLPLKMLLIIVSYFCGICSIVFFRGGIKRLFYKIIEIKK